MPGLWQCEPGSCPCLHQAGRHLGIMVPSHTLPKLLMDYFAVAELLGKTNGYLPTIFSSPGKLCVLCLNKYTCNSLPSILPFYFMESPGDFVYTSCA